MLHHPSLSIALALHYLTSVEPNSLAIPNQTIVGKDQSVRIDKNPGRAT